MSKKLSINQVKEAFELEGYTLLSEEYINNTEPLYYICNNGHKHKISWNKWKMGRRCPYCNPKGRVHNRDINEIKELFSKEGYILLDDVYKNTETKLSYICPNGHKHNVTFDKWQQGNRCPYCSGKARLTTKYIEKEFAKEGFILKDNYISANNKMKCICDKGHEIELSWASWYKGTRCSVCSGKKKHGISFIKKDFNKNGYELLDEKYINGKNKLNYICDKGHKSSMCWNNWQQGNRCPYCSTSSSKGEESVLKYINSLTHKVLSRDRKIISPYELDVVIPDKKLAIEYCGLYWHSELNGKDKNYHINKLNMCEEKGYHLITIFEDEWLFKQDIVKSRLASILSNKNRVVYARKCQVKEIPAKKARVFCEENHLQGYGSGSKVKLGLFYENELIAVMTFSKPSISKGINCTKEGVWELHRFCSKINTRVIGGASKLLKHFERNYNWLEIFSYADRRWSTGHLYKKTGFQYIGNTKPNYWYMNTKNYCDRKHRFMFRKNSNDNKDLTEWESRKSEGYDRIWDCGNIKMLKTVN